MQGRIPTLMGRHLFFPCAALPTLSEGTALCSVDAFLSLTSVSFTGYPLQRLKSRKHPGTSGCREHPVLREGMKLERGTAERYNLVAKVVKR